MPGTNEASTLFRQSYSRGLVVFFYGVAWLITMLAGYLLFDPLFVSGSGLMTDLVIATWASALAGGLGGATAMLSRLYRHISIEQDFQDQSVLSYLIQPFIGMLAGTLVLYLVAIPLALFINYTVRREFLFAEILASSTFMATQILLAWIAGFYQQRGLDKIRTITKRASDDEQSKPASTLDVVDEDAPLFFKAWVWQQKQMIRWSYTWGVFLFLYGIVWMIGLLAVFMMTGGISASLESNSNTAATTLILATWPAAVAGGLGGVCNLFYDLYRHVSIEQDFHRQHLMSYLVQPIIGFVFGLVIYLLLASGYLVITTENGSPQVVDTPTVIMLQLLLGWIAGFRQQYVTGWTQQLIQHIISLIKSVLTFFHPKNWFNKARRDQALTEIGQQTDLFKIANTDEPSSLENSN